jgi:DNA-binding MarR family transcriptional regulator
LPDTLERNGYIHRQSDPADRRRVLVDITPSAQALLDQVLPAVQQIVTAAMSPLGEQTLHPARRPDRRQRRPGRRRPA